MGHNLKINMILNLIPVADEDKEVNSCAIVRAAVEEVIETVVDV